MTEGMLRSELPSVPLIKRGKVRDIYDLGDHLLIVATDRISAYDVVMDTPITDKGRVLTAMSRWWFEHFRDLVPNHLVADEAAAWPADLIDERDEFLPRAMVVQKAEPLPVECIARAHLAGSGWRDYQRTGKVCGIDLPEGLQQNELIPGGPLFTPSTKADEGHDENISFDEVVKLVGQETADRIKDLTLTILRQAVERCHERGVILFDTKFEFGLLDGEIVLIDELLTPDSSRYCLKEDFTLGQPVVNLDKQYLRDWLDSTTWDKTPPPPSLPAEVVENTRNRYLEAYRRITGTDLD